VSGRALASLIRLPRAKTEQKFINGVGYLKLQSPKDAFVLKLFSVPTPQHSEKFHLGASCDRLWSKGRYAKILYIVSFRL
jgi:hypothetical protein